MKSAQLLSMLVLTTALTIAPCYAVEIQNFRSGLLCDIDEEFTVGDVPIRWICLETEIIHITGQGLCTYDGRKEKCTWYGYEFDYSNASEEEITCVSTSSVPINIGTPKGVDAEDVTVHEWSYTLPPGNGHHFNPQYSVAIASPDQQSSHDDETVCSVDGKELYRFRFTIIYPALTEGTVRETLMRHLRKAEKGQSKKE